MAGIYIHIPFCKQACYYCDFHFSTLLKNQPSVINAIIKELEMQINYLNEPIQSIYFGGGTPSLLSERELNGIFEVIFKNYKVENNIEITLEANPDDLNNDKINMLKNSPVNRLSVGIQSFSDEHLKFMNRAHTSLEAKEAIKNVQNAGFNNLSLDLIYNIPYKNHSILESDLEQLIALNPNHISAYSLTLEEKTVFGKWLKKGVMEPIEDDFAAEQFELVMQTLKNERYEQYEVSNFCKDENYAIHNSSYWLGKKYLGIGPGAHSYNFNSRSYNIANNSIYVEAINKNNLPQTKEILTEKEKINDYILTRIRTKWGIDLQFLKEKYKLDISEKLKFLESENLIHINNKVANLTPNGILLADFIAEKLFVD